MTIRENIIPIGKTRSGKRLTSFRGATIHNTGNANKGSNADAHGRFLKTNAKTRVAGWHYAVDEKEAVLSIPEGEIAYHSGDNLGNNTTVAIEICMNADGNLLAATNNGAELAADILRRNGHTKAVSGQNLFQHHDWSGKNCPQEIRAGRPYGWSEFVNQVNWHLGMGAAPKPTFHISKVLKKGMNDVEVTHITRNLSVLGYMNRNQTSVFDADIERGVKAFQRDYKLTEDGIVGRQTTEALGGVWDGK